MITTHQKISNPIFGEALYVIIEKNKDWRLETGDCGTRLVSSL